ncbi:MAG: hypothetical protein ACEPOV_00290 [Hyphomicrobiales bacterium]
MNRSFRYILFLFILAFPCMISAQSSIPDEMTEGPWFDNQPHHLYEHTITMIFGGGQGNQANYNFAPITTIAYKTADQVREQIKSDKSIDQEEADGVLEFLQQSAPGGIIFLYVTRYSERKANPGYYYASIYQNDKTLIWKGKLKYQPPNLPDGKGWWNYIEIPIPKEIKAPFTFYLNSNYEKSIQPNFGFKVE